MKELHCPNCDGEGVIILIPTTWCVDCQDYHVLDIDTSELEDAPTHFCTNCKWEGREPKWIDAAKIEVNDKLKRRISITTPDNLIKAVLNHNAPDEPSPIFNITEKQARKWLMEYGSPYTCSEAPWEGFTISFVDDDELLKKAVVEGVYVPHGE